MDGLVWSSAGELFNAFNHTNFGLPGDIFRSSSFGVISSAAAGTRSSVGRPDCLLTAAHTHYPLRYAAVLLVPRDSLLVRFVSVTHQFARSRTRVEASGEFLYARVGAEIGKLRIHVIVLKPSAAVLVSRIEPPNCFVFVSQDSVGTRNPKRILRDSPALRLLFRPVDLAPQKRLFRFSVAR